jgi:hypothetical protein
VHDSLCKVLSKTPTLCFCPVSSFGPIEAACHRAPLLQQGDNEV